MLNLLPPCWSNSEFPPFAGRVQASERRTEAAYALRAALRALTGGSIVAMTADVPVSQARTAGHGIVTLARLSGRPIIPVAAATSRFLVLNTWSKFSTLAVVASDPLFVAPDADDKELERMRLAVEKSLNTATARAYALAQSGSSHAVRVRPDTAPRGMSRW